MGQRYNIQFRGMHTNALYTVKIYDPQYGGQIYEVTASADNPAEIEQKEAKLTDVILGSGLDLNIVSESRYKFIHLFDDITDANPQKYNVEVFRESELIWLGFTVPELYTESFEFDENYEVSLSCSDGLALLERWSFLDNFENVFQGKTTLWDALCLCIRKIGLDYLGIRVSLSTTITNVSIPNDKTILHLLYADYSNFYDEDNEPCTYYEAVERILKPLSAQIYTEKGYIYITDNNTLATLNRSMECKEFYLNNFTFKEAVEVDVTVNESDLEIHTAGDLTLTGGLDQQKVTFSHYTGEDVFLHNLDYTPQAPNFVDWIPPNAQGNTNDKLVKRFDFDNPTWDVFPTDQRDGFNDVAFIVADQDYYNTGFSPETFLSIATKTKVSNDVVARSKIEEDVAKGGFKQPFLFGGGVFTISANTRAVWANWFYEHHYRPDDSDLQGYGIGVKIWAIDSADSSKDRVYKESTDTWELRSNDDSSCRVMLYTNRVKKELSANTEVRNSWHTVVPIFDSNNETAKTIKLRDDFEGKIQIELTNYFRAFNEHLSFDDDENIVQFVHVNDISIVPVDTKGNEISAVDDIEHLGTTNVRFKQSGSDITLEFDTDKHFISSNLSKGLLRMYSATNKIITPESFKRGSVTDSLSVLLLNTILKNNEVPKLKINGSYLYQDSIAYHILNFADFPDKKLKIAGYKLNLFEEKLELKCSEIFSE